MHISTKEFEERTGLDVTESGVALGHISGIVSMRDIVTPLKMEVMSTGYLKTLLSHVSIEGDHTCYPYRGCEIGRKRVDPEDLQIGQTFVQRSKYQGILENLPNVFQNFLTNGGAKCIALVIYGVTTEGMLGVAHYIPPIIEVHNNREVLLDGVHRNFVVRGIGTTIESIIIRGVTVPFPCEPGCWNGIRVVDEKPPRSERFRALRPELFRDLKYVGIDG